MAAGHYKWSPLSFFIPLTQHASSGFKVLN